MRILLSLLVLLSGCVQYRELLKTTSANCETLDNAFVFENDTLKVTYSFWAENGVMSFKIYNKLNIPIFVDWKISNFIINDDNLQYWYDKSGGEYANLKAVLDKHAYYGSNRSVPMDNLGNIKIEQRIVSITPRSFIQQSSYTMLPKGDKYIKTGEYRGDNSPVKFRNFLAFGMDEKFTYKFYIDNQFYVSRIELIGEDDFNGKRIGYDENGSPIFEYPYKSNEGFYTELILPYNQKEAKKDAVKSQKK